MGENTGAHSHGKKRHQPHEQDNDHNGEEGEESEEESEETYTDLEDVYASRSKRWKAKSPGKHSRFVEGEYYHQVFRAPPFCFQRRQARVDWRTLHAIHVDTLIQEIDIAKLETVLDTIAFGDIQGEDTRNFTEQNFIKLFRLAQLMIEYLLHVQSVLADQKSQLVVSLAAAHKKGEKLRLKCIWQHDALKQSRRDLKHAKKTVKTYDILLRSNGKQQPPPPPPPPKQVYHCPCCEKVFESAYYLDLHVSRRHSRGQEVRVDRTERALQTERSVPEERSTRSATATYVNKGPEKSAAQVRAETEAVLQAEFERHLGAPREESRTTAAQASCLHRAFHGSNRREDAEYQLGLLSSELDGPTVEPRDALDEIDEDTHRRLSDLERKFEDVEYQVQHISKDNIKLRAELDAAYRQLSALKISGKASHMGDKEALVEELDKKEKQLIKYMRKGVPEAGRHHRKPVTSTSDEDEDGDDNLSDLDDNDEDEEDAKNIKSLSDWMSETEERLSELTRGIAEEREEVRSHANSSSKKKQAKQFVELDDGTRLSARERWSEEHQCAPISDKPYALSKFEHGQSDVNKMAEEFDRRICAELKKYGISGSASGISDEMLRAAVSTLERQRMSRYSESPSSERKIMEYERSSIQWHIERAVRTRDLDRMESIFEEESEPDDDKSSSSFIEDEVSDKQEVDEERASSRASPSYGRRSPRPPFPAGKRSRSPSPPRDIKCRGGPSSGFTEQFVSKAFSWRADEENESHTFRVTGEVIAQRIKSPSGGSDVQHKIVISPVTSPVPPPIYEDEQVEEDLGLGEWESDDYKASSPAAASPGSPDDIQRQVMKDIQSRAASPAGSRATGTTTAKHKGKQVAVSSCSKSKQRGVGSSSNASDDIKMLDELDAEINDIIRM